MYNVNWIYKHSVPLYDLHLLPCF